MNKGVIPKQAFYDQLEPFASKYLPIHFFYNFGDNQRYCLVYDWASRKPNGDFDPIMLAQLYDNRISGAKKYIVPDLIWDCREKNTTTEYKLWKWLNAWATAALDEYEKGSDQNGFCNGHLL